MCVYRFFPRGLEPNLVVEDRFEVPALDVTHDRETLEEIDEELEDELVKT